MRVFFIFTLCFCWSMILRADDRPLIDVKVNDQTVRLVFDTGSEHSYLFQQTAKRINLNWTNPPPNTKILPGQILAGISEKCRFAIGKSTTQRQFRILNLPDYLSRDFDGVLAWVDVKNNILSIDVNKKIIFALSELPKNIDEWQKWDLLDLRQSSSTLAIKLPETSDSGGTILIDTGSPSGVELSDSLWKDCRDKHGNQRCTLSAIYYPSDGLKVYEEYWVDKLDLGQFSVKNISVRQSVACRKFMASSYKATLGLFSLTRFDIIIDSKNNNIYVRPILKPTLKYQYNRIAAVFVPSDKTDDLVAQVVENGPAYESGIRNGDVLAKIDDLDVTKWRTDPNVLPLSRFFERPAGNKLEMSLLRDGKPFKAIVELKEIFPQD